MRRLFLLALALFSLVWWIWRTVTPATRGRRATRGGREADPPAGGTMVRDRVCNTFLPRARALSTRLGSEEFFFCSERCRDSFLAGERQASEKSG